MASNRKIMVLPGDGIGTEIMKANMRVMDWLAKHRSLPLQIVPIGINYFSGHRFRSRVFLDIGAPFSVPPELAALYARWEELEAIAEQQ